MKRPAPRRRGMTLTEVMVGTAMVAIMATAMSSLIVTVQRAMTSYEASSGIQLAAQQAENRIFNNALQSKKIFDNTSATNVPGELTNGSTWIAAMCSAANTPSGGPAILTGSQLPTIVEGGTFSTSSNTFVGPGQVGNELMFLSVDSTTVLYLPSGSTVTVDTEHFNLYYVSQAAGSSGVGGQGQIVLQEWHSASFADYEELANLGSGLTTPAALALYNLGYRYAVDVDTALAQNGLYTIGSAGQLALMATANIPLQYTQPMIKILTGVTGIGYKYGVSPNTGGTFTTNYAVPVFALSTNQCNASASGSPCTALSSTSSAFPAGFETMLIGGSSGRQIFMRLVLVASGAFKGYKATGQSVSFTVRDVY
jgi:prepilin-type N-terminal cleavage/methylation domain-containing protein